MAEVRYVAGCDLCSFVCTKNFDLLKHLFEAHSNASNFLLSCPIGECTQTFSEGAKFSAFVSHANRKHRCWRRQVESLDTLCGIIEQHQTPIPEANTGDEDTMMTGSAETVPTASTMPVTSTTVCTSICHTKSVEKTAGHFLLSLKERHRLTQNAINFAVMSVKKLISEAQDDIVSSVIDQLNAQGMQTEDLNLQLGLPDPFVSLETEHMQTKFFKEMFGLVVS